MAILPVFLCNVSVHALIFSITDRTLSEVRVGRVGCITAWRTTCFLQLIVSDFLLFLRLKDE